MTEFIFMLTRDDVTISDALDVYKDVRDSDLRWVGFKDIGLPFEQLHELADRIRSDGRKVALEVVSLDEESEVRSAEAALRIGVDLLMGGLHADAILPMLAHTNVLYYPFPGKVVGHPSILEGSLEEIAASARRLSSLHGVHGLDLLAYRFSGDVPRLIRTVVRQATGPIVVAGSIDSSEKIRVVRAAGAWGFTVGSAVLERAFPAKASNAAQVRFVLDALSAADEWIASPARAAELGRAVERLEGSQNELDA